MRPAYRFGLVTLTHPAGDAHAGLTEEMTMNENYIAVRVDDENTAEAWWDAARQQYPDFTRSLERNGTAIIHASLWNSLAALPGFSDGPDYAPTALIDCGGEGEQWVGVAAGRHGVFDALS